MRIGIRYGRRTVPVPFLLVALLVLFSCNSDDSPDTGLWRACPDYSRLADSAECAWVSAPLDYDAPDTGSIDLFIYRYRGSGQEKKGQVWLFEGGPGGSGVLLAGTARYLADHYPDYDFYSMDHRGVANSTRLGCPDDTDITGFDRNAYEDCITDMQAEWGDRLRFFSTTNAARDIQRVSNLFREKDRSVFLYAVSYGTYWLQRYLQLYPDDVDGIILDSICSPTECYLDRYDGWNNTVGEQFLDFCAADPQCSGKMAVLADSPLEAVRQTFEKLDNGELCEPFQSMLDRQTLRNALAMMLQNWSQRVLIPPLIYRLNRCSASDRQAVENLFDVSGFQTRSITTAGGGRLASVAPVDEDRLPSPMLRDHITQSELYGGESLEVLETFGNTALFADDSSLFAAQIYDAGIWPAYHDPIYAQRLAETDIPMLMLNGTTDPQTPYWIAQITGNHFTGAFQRYLQIPYATHGTIIFSPTDKPLPDGGQTPCGMQLMMQFIDDPRRSLDTSCIDGVYPLEFDPASENNQTTSEKYFGTTDMWEG